MIKYIGSKRVLVPSIRAAFEQLPHRAPVLDLFSGTSRVGHALKSAGFAVHANDHNHYAWMLAGCYVAADRDRLLQPARLALEQLQQAPAADPDHWFVQTYCHQSRYLQPDNGARIAGMRQHLDQLAPAGSPLRPVLMTALLEAADRVDSTVGVQMAWLKSWSRRSANPVKLRLPQLLPGPGVATCREALDAAASFKGPAAYLDPPYNQHSYLGNYHLWETLVRWDQPQVYGKACKRVEVRARKSPFNSKRQHAAATAAVVDALACPWLILSFSDEGYLSRDQLEAMLRPRGHVAVVERVHERYVGAKIGIHDPQGRKVGRVGHLENRERLYIVGPDKALVGRMAAAAADPPRTR